MKKIIFLVLILLLNTACSNISKRSKITIDDQRLKAFNMYYDNWELELAELELNQLELKEQEKNNLIEKLTIRKNNKTEFKKVLNEISVALKVNDFNALEKYVALNIINEIKLRELKKNDYSKVKIYFGKDKFNKENAETLMLINYLEETLYIDLIFELIDNKKWKLVSFKERR